MDSRVLLPVCSCIVILLYQSVHVVTTTIRFSSFCFSDGFCNVFVSFDKLSGGNWRDNCSVNYIQ